MRVSNKQLEVLVEHINKMQGEKTAPYTKTAEGYKANVGTYHLSYAYGGVSLHRMDNESGGVSNVFSIGYVKKRELYDMLHAYIRGLQEKRGAK